MHFTRRYKVKVKQLFNKFFCFFYEFIFRYFNCNAEIEHYRYWVKENEDAKKGPNLVDRLTHRYTQDNKTLIFCVIVDPVIDLVS